MNLRILLVLIAAAAAVMAPAQRRHDHNPDAAQVSNLPPLLAHALRAAPHLRYSGVRVVELKVGPDRLRHTEFVIRDGSRTRIEFPADGPYHGQIIVEDAQERRHYLPDKNEVRILPPRREEAYERLAKMLQRQGSPALVQVAAGDLVAGLRTQLVTVNRSAGGVMQRIWIEPRSGMLLKRELYDKTGNLQAFFEFTKVDLTPIIHRTDFILQPKDAKIVTPRDNLRALITAGGFLDVSLPANDAFKLEQAHVQKRDSLPILIQVYVSPEGRFTLFQVRSTIDPAKLNRQARGEFKTISWQKNGSSFVIVGDLPQDRLRAVSQRLGA